MELRYCEGCGDIIPVEGEAQLSSTETPYLCLNCGGGGVTAASNSGESRDPIPEEEKTTGEDSRESVLDEPSMDLFSDETVRITQKELESRVPSRRGVRMTQFACLHCGATLRIHPVETLSRLACPKCQGNLVIDPKGTVSKTVQPASRPVSRPVSPGLPVRAPVAPDSGSDPEERPSRVVLAEDEDEDYETVLDADPDREPASATTGISEENWDDLVGEGLAEPEEFSSSNLPGTVGKGEDLDRSTLVALEWSGMFDVLLKTVLVAVLISAPLFAASLLMARPSPGFSDGVEGRMGQLKALGKVVERGQQRIVGTGH